VSLISTRQIHFYRNWLKLSFYAWENHDC